jgi:uncharacterized damage-inducible protein DinB
MSTKAAQQGTVSAKLIARWERTSEKLAGLADEMPANKFDYKPIESLRTFEEVLRHVAFWNYYVADSARGKTPNDAANELSKEDFRTKAAVIKVLRRSAADAAEALKDYPAQLTPEMAEMIGIFIEHTSEHYGQLSVYARLNGIVPPASRNP